MYINTYHSKSTEPTEKYNIKAETYNIKALCGIYINWHAHSTHIYNIKNPRETTKVVPTPICECTYTLNAAFLLQ
jgi:hypothetical protein